MKICGGAPRRSVFFFSLVVFSAAATEATLSSELWQENYPLALESLLHPWVLALGDGTLPRESFDVYIAQDAYFLLAFARSYGRALSKCPNLRCITAIHKLTGAVVEELDLHDSRGADPSSSPPLAATAAYTQFLEAVGRNESTSTLEVLAAMAPCMSLYAFIGKALAAFVTPSHPYADWIDTYASSDFAQAARDVEDLLNELFTLQPDDNRARPLYATAMRLEFDFFDAQAKPVAGGHTNIRDSLLARLGSSSSPDL